jgi:outer membrane receptor protein involved in Fe transport
LTRARVAADGPAVLLNGLRPAQTPKFAATGAIGWEDRGRAASLIVRHVDAQFEDDLNQQRLPPATTVDGFLAWPVFQRVQLVARAQNLFNEEVVAGISDATVERATPRTFWLGLRINRR